MDQPCTKLEFHQESDKLRYRIYQLEETVKQLNMQVKEQDADYKKILAILARK